MTKLIILLLCHHRIFLVSCWIPRFAETLSNSLEQDSKADLHAEKDKNLSGNRTPKSGRPSMEGEQIRGNGIALVVDTEITSYLMMGALSPGLKRHSVSLFEGNPPLFPELCCKDTATFKSVCSSFSSDQDLHKNSSSQVYIGLKHAMQTRKDLLRKVEVWMLQTFVNHVHPKHLETKRNHLPFRVGF